MDFFQFLQKSSNSQDNTNKKCNKNIVQQENKQLDNQENKQLDNQENKQLDNQEITVYKNIKRGDFIKIIYVKNSNLNNYKGYVGEIREYRKDQESAVIFLHALYSHNTIKFPLQHFIKID